MKVYINKHYGVCATTPEQAVEEVLKKRRAICEEHLVGIVRMGCDIMGVEIFKVAYVDWRDKVRGVTLHAYEVKGA